jgi:7-carboxy-7-deazaguanine synthase
MRVSEIYASVQGEGPNTGQTTVFVRFGGCNLRCPGWPCDTDHAVLPSFRNEWKTFSPEDLFVETYKVAKMSGAKLVTLTGGEPFLQQGKELGAFVQMLRINGLTVEAFTNGTVKYPSWAVDQVHMVMDYKLPGSGEYGKLNGIRTANIIALADSVIEHSIKFVCKDIYDYSVARTLWSTELERHQFEFIWYYGKVWDGNITDAELVEHVMRDALPWRLNVQLHNIIWPPNERGR